MPVANSTGTGQSRISREPFGCTASGTAVERVTLHNSRGMQASITNYGGIVTALTAPDHRGRYADVVLGYDSLAGYLGDDGYFGALIGRCGNRIAQGRFRLDGREYTLAANNAPHSLHGGAVGFDKVVWTVVGAAVGPGGPTLSLAYFSPDGEEGYPGNLRVTADYTLTESNALRLDLAATTDRATVVNMTQHSYFNLRGRGDILGHVLQIDADYFTPVDDTLIPTGEIRSVEGTPFDFRTPTAIGARIASPDEQLAQGHGYDHNWIIRKAPGTLAVHATVHEPQTGRVLEVSSSAPGLQFYSGNVLDGTQTGKGGATYGPRSGFALEPQHFPDAPNHPHFPSVVLHPGSVYRHTIVHRFYKR